MVSANLAIMATGMVSSVGLSAAATCAALRAKVSVAKESSYSDSLAETVMVHEVPLATQWRGRYRLVHMASLAMADCLAAWSEAVNSEIPIFLCVAEWERPGRLDRLDDSLLRDICVEAGIRAAPASEVLACGRAGLAFALSRCRDLFATRESTVALIVAVDSLLTEQTVNAFDRSGRLLTQSNSNGFIPGEGAGALLVGPGGRSGLHCAGLGFGNEAAHIESDLPLRGYGLSAAARAALGEASLRLDEIDYRISDIAGEHYYFKEVALVSARLMRRVVPEIDLWHPAECIGETGALAGVALAIVAEAAARKNYAPGHRVLSLMSVDNGHRAAAVFEYRVSDE